MPRGFFWAAIPLTSISSSVFKNETLYLSPIVPTGVEPRRLSWQPSFGSANLTSWHDAAAWNPLPAMIHGMPLENNRQSQTAFLESRHKIEASLLQQLLECWERRLVSLSRVLSLRSKPPQTQLLDRDFAQESPSLCSLCGGVQLIIDASTSTFFGVEIQPSRIGLAAEIRWG
ncbi:hypothetical protein DFH09DRAFT_1485946 [Mycena vulgaris]|nr:hypothetical protein DFH09DRAFT_1485946 [Mycena vulgaris]